MALTAHMVTIDCADPQRLAKFWADAAGYELKWQHENEFVILVPAWGEGVALGLQRVTEIRAGKNRVHVDWSADDRQAEVARLVRLGATVLQEQVTPGLAWTVLADPEGNEFCVSAAHG
ncbi:VOC family protein [Micromonospora sonneratiae]|jgi:predicted enzyme related to lactoylglutathione lyase|uniref:VOC family protein n=1 Tax=Micromonospora sonneratiae TaxID=1184706 RepID=A0ABW3YB34_9ACTN